MEKLLTISVAAYNVEKYIEECLVSFINEAFINNIVVLIINDGSTDNTACISARYEEKYPGIFRLVNKKNGGHGSAVNCGISEAKGRYFKTVDGDDWVDTGALRELIDFIKVTDADVISTDYWWVDDKTYKKTKEIKNTFKGLKYRKKYKFDRVCSDIYINMHAMAIKTEILQKNKIKLDTHCFYVDAEYVLFPVPYIKTIAFLPKPVYMYRLGLSTQSMDLLNMQKNCQNHEKVLSRIVQLYNKNKNILSNPKKEYIEKAIAKLVTSQIKIYLSYPASKENKKKITRIENIIRKKYPEVYFKMTNKAVFMLRSSNYMLYGIASIVLRKAAGL